MGTVVGINETLPIDSPFFADTISNEDRAFIRRFVEDNGVGRCGTVSAVSQCRKLKYYINFDIVIY